jgi:hypothetical protein
MLHSDGSLNITTSVNLGDNEKAYFGTSNDLHIYHDASASYIDETGTGSLYIRSNGTQVFITDSTSSNHVARFTPGGEATLYNAGNIKLQTTGTGVDVTGDLQADGVNIGTTSSVGSLTVSEDTTDLASFEVPAQSNSLRIRHTSGGNMRFGMTTSHNLSLMTNAVDRVTVNNSGFIGIGQSSPQKILHITKNNSDGVIVLDANGVTTDHQICFSKNYGTGGTTGGNYWGIGVDGSENKLVFAYDPNAQASLSADAKVVLDSSGNVGIGIANPDTLLHVYGQGKFENNLILNENNPALVAPSGDLRIFTGGSEKVRITSSGNVGIGDQAPSEKLNVAGNVMLEGSEGFVYLTNVGTGNNGIYVRGNTAGSFLRSHSTGDFTWEVTGSEQMRLNPTGLGIGGSPAHKLDIFGNGSQLNFNDANSRITFAGHRALEGNTAGTNLQVGEGYSGITLQANVTVTGNLSATGSISGVGKVAQLLVGEQTATQGSSSQSFTDTGITVNITPTSSSSKIYVLASVQVGGQSGQRFGARFVRVNSGASTVIGNGNAAGSRQLVSAAGSGSSGNQLDASLTMQTLDTPATTNTLTYKVQMLSENTTNYEINRSYADADSTTVFRASSQICVMEILQ